MSDSPIELKQRRATVTQGNALARSAQQMTLYEKRLVYVAIASISRDQTDFVTTDIPVAELERLFGVNTKAIYKIAKDTALSLLERTILIGSDTDGWTAFQWVSRARYVPSHKHPSRNATLQITFHEDLKPYLLQLRENFNTVPLLQLLSIPSFNSSRLFELLHHDSFRGQKSFLTYEIEDLKKRIGLEGKYAKFKDFRYVLDRAVSDLATYTGLCFSYTGIQQGRSYSQVRFRVWPNPNYMPPVTQSEALQELEVSSEPDEATLALMRKLSTAGYTQDALETISQYGIDRVRNNLALAEKKASDAARSAKPVRNLGGLIAYMIQSDVAGKEAEAQTAASEGLTSRKVRELAMLLKDAFETDLRGASVEIQEALSEDELGELHDIMRVDLNRFVLTQLDKAGWKGAGYKAALHTVLYQKRPELFPSSLRTFEAWSSTNEFLSDYSEEEKRKIVGAVTTDI